MARGKRAPQSGWTVAARKRRHPMTSDRPISILGTSHEEETKSNEMSSAIFPRNFLSISNKMFEMKDTQTETCAEKKKRKTKPTTTERKSTAQFMICAMWRSLTLCWRRQTPRGDVPSVRRIRERLSGRRARFVTSNCDDVANLPQLPAPEEAFCTACHIPCSFNARFRYLSLFLIARL